MPLRHENTRTFHRTLFGPGVSKRVTLLKRNPDQRAGVVRSVTLFDCKRSSMTKTAEPVQEDMSADHRCTWLLPVIELNRNGVEYVNALDRIVEYSGDGVFSRKLPLRYWQPESTTNIEVALFSNFVRVDCLRVDPPNATTLAGK